MLLRRFIILAIVVQRAEIDLGRRMFGIKLQNPFVGSDRLQLVARILLQRHSAGKHFSHVYGHGLIWSGGASRYWNACYYLLAGRKIEHELASDRLQELSVMSESHPVMTGAECAGLEQRVLHAGGLLLHRCQRLANFHRTHMAGAQVAYFFHLKKVKKSVALCRSEQASPFPSGQLPGVETQNPNKIFSAVSVHG